MSERYRRILFIENKVKHSNNKKRAWHLLLVIAAGFFLVFAKLAWLMVIQHDEYAEKAKQQYVRVTELSPGRGVIYDRKMRELAVNLELESLYAQPHLIPDPAKAATALAPILNYQVKSLEKKLQTKRKFIWLRRKMERKEVEQVNALNIAGLDFISEMKRYYPKSGTASHILGFTNIDNLGLDGIEKTFDPNLRGQPGLFLLNTDARQKMIYKNQQDPVPGNSIVLTIDEQLQYITERELDKAMEQWKAQAAVAIMMDPYTGGILALANKPDYNPNFPGKYTSHQRRNRAVTDMYEPGSTFKSFLASAALEEKVVKVEQRFDCSRGYIQLGGRKIKDVHRNGVLTFNKVLQKSSNVGMVQVGYLLGKKRYYEYMSGFGFGRKTDSGLPGEISGYLANVKNWSGLSLGSMSIGQEIGVTPLQVARGYCAIANGGLMVKPYIVSKILDSSGKTIKHYPPTIEKRIISKETSDTMKSILETVTQEGGTAINAAIKGNPVAGKTGTAQMIDPVTKTYSNKDYVSSFVGFVPADKPRFVLIVVVYQPRGAIYGGAVAAPVFRAIAEEALTYLDVPVDVDDTQYTKVVTR